MDEAVLKEYKEKCTEDNFLFIKLLQYLLTYFIAMKVGKEKGRQK